MSCTRCGGEHERFDFLSCPMVKTIEIDDDNRITRVEFMVPIDFPPGSKEEPEVPYQKLKSSGE